MLLAEIAGVSRAVTATSGRLEKVALLAGLLRRLAAEERPVVAAWLSGDLPRGRIGVGYAAVRSALAATGPAAAPSLDVAEVERALEAIRAARGPRSGAIRRSALEGLLGRATEEERRLLSGLLLGELRQGALEGVLVEALARAAEVPAAEVRRAAMLAGSLPPVAAEVLARGAAGLDRFRLRLLEPVQPMLAQSAATVDAALAALGGEAAFEWKLDGARIQVHKEGDAVRVFSRSLRDVTAAVPGVVAAARAAAARTAILDGEAVALAGDGTPEPFQVTMRRFGRKVDAGELTGGLPLTAFFFDVLHADGADLLAAGNAERRAALERAVPPDRLVPRLVTRDAAAAAAFLDGALARGQEGVVAKALGAPYEAGRRGAAWLKVKRAHTLDLVVLAAEWGSGRRKGWLSNLHLGARDPASGGWAMLGKTFKGMTDEMLRWQTERLSALAVSPLDGFEVRVRPELVVEVAFDGIQESPRYASGLALRFARVKRYREDKRPEEADTIDAVRALYAGPPSRADRRR